MRILGLTAALAIVSLFAFLAGSANAVTINPYVSGKVSIGEGQMREKEVISTTDGGSTNTSHSDHTHGNVRGYLAGGIEMPQPALRGAFRFEAELGLGATEKFNIPTPDVAPDSPDVHVKMKATTIFANAFYDFHATEKIKPYLGAGLGWARISTKLNWSYHPAPDARPDLEHFINHSESTNKFAFHVGAGVAYNLTENIALDLGYRYTDLGKISMTAIGMTDDAGNISVGSTADIQTRLHQNEVMLGLRYTF